MHDVSSIVKRNLLFVFIACFTAGCGGLKTYRDVVGFCKKIEGVSERKCRREYRCHDDWSNARCGRHISKSLRKSEKKRKALLKSIRIIK